MIEELGAGSFPDDPTMNWRRVSVAGREAPPIPADRNLDIAAGPLGLLDWAAQALDPFRPAAHHRLLLAALERVADGSTERLMVLMPPGSAKSTYCSVVLPPWWLHRHPGHSIISACHTESLGRHFGRRARALALAHAGRLGLTLARDNRAAGSWSTADGGAYYAAGVRGPIVGRRADLVVIDDPVKSHAEADSSVLRDSLWHWFQSDLVPRLKPRGRIVLVMTRWHEDDLGGRLLQAGDGWDVLRLPALAEAADPLGREPDAALWPEWEDAAALARKRLAVGERSWAALFQQRPTSGGGSLFPVARLVAQPATPQCSMTVRAWDLAATVAQPGSDPDWTVGVKLGRCEDGSFCVLDVVRLRGAPLAVERAIMAAAAADGTTTVIGLPQDPGQAGKQQVAYLSARLAGWRVVASPESGSKLTRAGPVSAQVEAGLLGIVTAPWNVAFIDELRDFPGGRKDDQVDALSRAFAMLTATTPGARRMQLDLVGR